MSAGISTIGISKILLNNRPSQETIQERDDMVRTQLWLQGQRWPTMSLGRRALRWLTRPVPRMDMLYAVRAAMESPVLAP